MKRFFFLMILIFFVSCAKHVSNSSSEEIAIPQFGNADSFEIVCWNIENFPRTSITDSVLAEIITDLNVDLFGVEEIVDEAAFNRLLDRLPTYKGLVVGDPGYQKVGFVYDTTVFGNVGPEKIKLLFEDDYDFPREPLQVSLSVNNGTKSFDFNFIVLHLKAFTDSQSQTRRKNSINKLYAYLTEQLGTSEPDFVVAGDWNSDYTQEDFLLTTFNSDTLFDLLTYRFFQNSQTYEYNASYPSYGSLLDHFVVTRSFENQVELLEVKTLRIDDYFNRYGDLISDHRPVGIRFTLK